MMIGFKQHKLKKRSPHKNWSKSQWLHLAVTFQSYVCQLVFQLQKPINLLKKKKILEMFQQQSKSCNNSQGPLRSNSLEIDVTLDFCINKGKIQQNAFFKHFSSEKITWLQSPNATTFSKLHFKRSR